MHVYGSVDKRQPMAEGSNPSTCAKDETNMKRRKLTPERVARMNRQDTLKNGNVAESSVEDDRKVLVLVGNHGTWNGGDNRDHEYPRDE